MFKMKFNKDELEGPKPLPAGLYQVRFVGFKPKMSTKGDSINLNMITEVINHPEHDKRQIWLNLNTQIPSFIQDAVHSFGLEMEDQLSDNPQIPGVFDGNPATFVESKPETWVYAGPLTNRTGAWEIIESEYNGKPNNKVAKCLCQVEGCAEKFPLVQHSNNMAKKG